jgi:hypothetical protein
MKAEISYSSAEQRQKMVNAEHELTDERVRKIIALKRQVSGPAFVRPSVFFFF